MKISSNMTALLTITNLNKANISASRAMERLSTGLKINSASDDSAGMAIANKLNSQVKGLGQASQNAMNDVALIQTAEGALNEVHAMLNRLKELNVQAENGTLTDDDREKIQSEVDSLVNEIKKTGENTEYNQMSILNTNDKIWFQIGANAHQDMSIDGSEIKLSQVYDLFISGGQILDIDHPLMSEQIDKAIEMTSKIRGKLGAAQNRLEHTINNLNVSEENMISSLSRIQDADMAEEMTNYTQYNVITQAGISMLAQANQRPQQVLQLLNS